MASSESQHTQCLHCGPFWNNNLLGLNPDQQTRPSKRLELNGCNGKAANVRPTATPMEQVESLASCPVLCAEPSVDIAPHLMPRDLRETIINGCRIVWELDDDLERADSLNGYIRAPAKNLEFGGIGTRRSRFENSLQASTSTPKWACIGLSSATIARSEPSTTSNAMISACSHPKLALITSNFQVYAKTVCLYITAPASSPSGLTTVLPSQSTLLKASTNRTFNGSASFQVVDGFQ